VAFFAGGGGERECLLIRGEGDLFIYSLRSKKAPCPVRKEEGGSEKGMFKPPLNMRRGEKSPAGKKRLHFLVSLLSHEEKGHPKKKEEKGPHFLLGNKKA